MNKSPKEDRKKKPFDDPELVVYGGIVRMTTAVMGMSSFADGSSHPTKNKTR